MGARVVAGWSSPAGPEIEHFLERACSIWAYAWDFLPGLWARFCHCRDASEVQEQGSRADGRGARHRGQNHFGRFFRGARPWALGIDRAIRQRRSPYVARKRAEPHRRVPTVLRPDQTNASRDRPDTDSANRFRCDRAVVEISSLDEEERPPARASQLVDLVPKPPSENRLVKIGKRLSFDEDRRSNRVVAGGKRNDFDLQTGSLDGGGTAPSLTSSPATTPAPLAGTPRTPRRTGGAASALRTSARTRRRPL
jgi:hypothetical protein